MASSSHVDLRALEELTVADHESSLLYVPLLPYGRSLRALLLPYDGLPYLPSDAPDLPCAGPLLPNGRFGHPLLPDGRSPHPSDDVLPVGRRLPFAE